MDERIDGAIRLELAAMLGPAAGSHPRWAGSPAAVRVAGGEGAGGVARRLGWAARQADGDTAPGARGLLGGRRRGWVLALVAALLLVGGTVALAAGGLLPSITLPVVPPPTMEPTAPPTAPTPQPSSTPVPTPAPATVTTEAPPSGFAASIMDVAFDEAGVAWFATTRGVVRWKPGATTSLAYGEADGLPAASISRVAVGPDGSVWASGAGWVAHLAPGHERWNPLTQFGAKAVEVGGLIVGPGEGPAIDGRSPSSTAWAALTLDDGTSRLLRLDCWAGIGTELPIDCRGMLFPAPVESYSTPWAGRLAIDDAGRVWAATLGTSALYAWDGSAWTLMGSKADLGGDPSLAGVAPDGSVWVNMGAICLSQDGPCPDPGNGVARFDGEHWNQYGTADGLLDTDVRLQVGPDGSLWATYDFVPGAISRFDGTRWVTQAARVPDGARVVGVAPDGRLWLAGTDDLLATDGKTVLHLGMPEAPAPAPMPLVLEPTGETGSTDGPTGPISWRTFTLPTGHLFIPVGSAHGPVANEGSVLRWSTDGGVTWQGTPLSSEPWRVMADGDDLVVYGEGATRLTWLNDRWVEAATMRFEPAPISVEEMAFGPRGAVAVAGASLYFSRDGVTFRRAAREPSADAPTGGIPGDEGIRGGCEAPGGSSWPGTGSIGPVLATADGFVAFTAADPADWNDRPLCEPLAWTSTDGDAWTLASTTSPFGDGAWVAQVAGRDGRFVAVGGAGGNGKAWVSDDGVSWRDLGLDLGFAGWTVAADDRGWVMASLDTSPTASGLRISADGTTWEPLPSTVPAPGGYIGPVIAPYAGGMTIANGGQVAVVTLDR